MARLSGVVGAAGVEGGGGVEGVERGCPLSHEASPIQAFIQPYQHPHLRSIPSSRLPTNN